MKKTEQRAKKIKVMLENTCVQERKLYRHVHEIHAKDTSSIKKKCRVLQRDRIYGRERPKKMWDKVTKPDIKRLHLMKERMKGYAK